MTALRTTLPFLAPVHVLVLGIIGVPAVYIVWLSLTNSTYGLAPSFVGFDNYVRVLGDPYFWRALKNTVILILIVVHVELIVGLGMALLFAGKLPAKRFLLAAVLAPYAVSEVTAVVMWRFLFDPDVGPVTLALQSLGLPTLEWSVVPAHGLIIVGLLSIWLHLPFTFIILYAARIVIPSPLYEAARIDGATAYQAFWRITLPILAPAMLMAMLFRFIFAFRLFSEVWLMTQGGPARTTEVVAVYLYMEAFRYNAFGSASATGWIMVVVSMVLASGYLWKLKREMAANAA